MFTPTIKQARYTHAAGGFGFIFIGALHTAVHFAALSGAELEQRFRTMGTIQVSGQTPESWNLFQGTSILMGLFSLAIGGLNLGTLRATPVDQPPPLAVGAISMTTLAGIIAVGATHLGPLQIYGGLAGLALFGVGVVANISDNARPTLAN